MSERTGTKDNRRGVNYRDIALDYGTRLRDAVKLMRHMQDVIHRAKRHGTSSSLVCEEPDCVEADKAIRHIGLGAKV